MRIDKNDHVYTLARKSLKALAAKQEIRDAFLDSDLLSATLRPAAMRYILAESQSSALTRIHELATKGYSTGLEYVGEEARTDEEVSEVMNEYITLIDRPEIITAKGPVQLGFDLSNVGSSESYSYAVENTKKLLMRSAPLQIPIILSMERSSETDDILTSYETLASSSPNIGVTLQAQLLRTPSDIASLNIQKRFIRLVKGVYWEDDSVALPRGDSLDQRYLEIAEQLIETGAHVSIATQDPRLIAQVKKRGLLSHIREVEMLHGVNPHLMRALKDEGVSVRVAGVYGTNWWLHFIHRLSEEPSYVMEALADLTNQTPPTLDY